MNDRLAALETHFANRQKQGSAQEQVVAAQQGSYTTDSPVAKLASLQSKMQDDAANLPSAPEPEREVVSQHPDSPCRVGRGRCSRGEGPRVACCCSSCAAATRQNPNC